MKVAKKLLYRKLRTSYSPSEATSLAKRYNKMFVKDLLENIQFVQSLFNNVDKKIVDFKIHLQGHFTLSSEGNYPHNFRLSESLVSDLHDLQKLILGTKKELATMKTDGVLNSLDDLEEYETKMYHFKEFYRYVASKVASLYTGPDWRSPSYSFSQFANIFYVQDTNKKVVNYKRYGYNKAEELEDWYKTEILESTDPRIKSLVTASGMSSYALIEDFLTKYVLKDTDLVMTSPYVYFENFEQLNLSRQGNVKVCSSYDYKIIIKEIQQFKPKAIFLDPITNTGTIHLIDVYALLKRLDKMKLTQPLYIIIDSTVLADGFNAFKHKDLSNKNVRVLTFESCNKYRQLGMELTMLGVISGYTDDIEKIERSRRNTGQIPYDYYLHAFPSYDKKISLYRFGKLSRNALLLATLLQKDKKVNDIFHVGYPLLPSNPYRTIAKKYNLCGGLVTLLFKDENLCSVDEFNTCIGNLLNECKQSKLPLNHGISFGFEVTRVSASASMATTTDPFLRIAVGPDLIHNILLLKQQIKSVAESYDVQVLREQKKVHDIALQQLESLS